MNLRLRGVVHSHFGYTKRMLVERHGVELGAIRSPQVGIMTSFI